MTICGANVSIEDKLSDAGSEIQLEMDRMILESWLTEGATASMLSVKKGHPFPDALGYAHVRYIVTFDPCDFESTSSSDLVRISVNKDNCPMLMNAMERKQLNKGISEGIDQELKAILGHGRKLVSQVRSHDAKTPIRAVVDLTNVNVESFNVSQFISKAFAEEDAHEQQYPLILVIQTEDLCPPTALTSQVLKRNINNELLPLISTARKKRHVTLSNDVKVQEFFVPDFIAKYFSKMVRKY